MLCHLKEEVCIWPEFRGGTLDFSFEKRGDISSRICHTVGGWRQQLPNRLGQGRQQEIVCVLPSMSNAIFYLWCAPVVFLLNFPSLIFPFSRNEITDKELKTLVREVSSSNLRNTVEFNEFLQLMSRKLKNDGCEEELLEAFR